MRESHSWHALGIAETAQQLDVRLECGLDPAEAERRLREFGPNSLPEKPGRSRAAMFFDQFKNVLTLVLLAAGAVAGMVGDVADMLVIISVVVFNAVLGFYQEYRAERILDALKNMLAPRARVRRGGDALDIAAESVVPGDVVLIEAGDRVPADGRLIAGHGLEIDESGLTGESVPIGKDHACILADDAGLADRSNQAFMNTVVTRGRGEMLATATGNQAEMGRIAQMLADAPDGATPLQRRLDGLGRRLAMIAAAVVTVIFIMGMLRGQNWLDTAMTAIALAVAAIPEGLPAVVAVTLAIGMHRMAKRGAIVKRLAAVETLGSADVICSDKTGTLTLNQMTARQVWCLGRRWTASGDGYSGSGEIKPLRGPADNPARALLAAGLCNDSHVGEDGVLVGDPTEGALAALARKAGPLPDWPRVDEVPFDSARKFMVTVHQTPDGLRMLIKGAPDVLLDLCSQVLDADGPVVLDDRRRDLIRSENAQMAAGALRVLALAEARIDQSALADLPAALHDLTLTALVGLMDPPRPGAREAISQCRRAGIAVKMITGDHRGTAAAVARMLGLDGEVITGAELDRMDDAELAGHVDQTAVFARTAPQHKVRIVAALQARGHIVAMTGDGINDSPALRRADIGIAMGRAGSDVAREAAAMVLTDDDFSTVVRAVHEGRTITDNIIKFVRFQLSTNMGALLTVFLAPFLGLPAPFHPIQILWVNIIMDGPPAMALAFDPARRGLMTEKPAPHGRAVLPLSRFGRLALYGGTMCAGSLAVLWWAMGRGDAGHAQTLAFTTFVLFQFFNVFNARVGEQSAVGLHMFKNGKLLAALAGVLALQAAAVHWPPMQTLFHTTALSAFDWVVACATASSVMVLDEGRKLAQRLWRGLVKPVIIDDMD